MASGERMVAGLEAALRRVGDPDRAAGAQRYLRSELTFLGVGADALRRALTEALPPAQPLGRRALWELVEALWRREVFELRAAAVEVLTRRRRTLGGRDLARIERLLRDSRTWALVDGLAIHVAGDVVERVAESGEVLDRWAGDHDFWIRRSALLALLLPLRRGAGDLERFLRYADTMADEREFFIRKAIGWVLREVGKRRPEPVAAWLGPRLPRVSGVTFREAVRYLPEPSQRALLAAFQARRPLLV